MVVVFPMIVLDEMLVVLQFGEWLLNSVCRFDVGGKQPQFRSKYIGLDIILWI